MTMFKTAVRLSAISLMVGTAACEHTSTTGTGMVMNKKEKPERCKMFEGCSNMAEHGVLVLLDANFKPGEPAGVLKKYKPDRNGDGPPTANWRNDGQPNYPGEKRSSLDVDLTGISPDRKGFAYVAIELADTNTYFFDDDAIVAEDAKGRRFLREAKALDNKSGKRVVVKVKLVGPTDKWIEYDLYVMKKVDGGRPQPFKVDPKIKNTG